MKNTFYMFICVLLLSNVALPCAHADTNRGDVHFRRLQLDVPQAVTSGGTGSATGDISALTAQVGSAKRSLAVRFGETVNAEDYGVVCDWVFGTGGTDNTSTLAAAISVAQSSVAQGQGKKLVLPTGLCLTGPQTITGQIFIEGQSSFATSLVLKSGSTSPLLTFNPNYPSNFPMIGYPSGMTYVRDLRLTSENGASTNASYPNAHGLYFPANANEMFYYIDDIIVYNMPGHGVSAAGINGFANFLNPYIISNGGRGFNTNSTQDWIVRGANLSGNYLTNFVSSGDGRLYIENLNSFTSRQHGFEIYGASTVVFAGHTEINLNAYSGLYLLGLTSGSSIVVQDSVFGGNSSSAANTYPAVLVDTSAGRVTFENAEWISPYQAGNLSNNESMNVKFVNGSTTQVSCSVCNFRGNSIATPGVTNNAGLFTHLGQGPSGWQASGTGSFTVPTGTTAQEPDAGLAGEIRFNTTTSQYEFGTGSAWGNFVPTTGGTLTGLLTLPQLSVVNAMQYRGLTIANGTYTSVVLEGTTASNDSGVLGLSIGGVTTVKISAGNGIPSYVTTNMGFGGNTSPAYPVDVNGAIHATAYISGGGGLYSVVNSWTGVPVGARSYITDAVSCSSHLSAVVGGGALFCPVVYNGSSWLQE